jgi:methylenetetrahydrofolate reductase (NADPH)
VAGYPEGHPESSTRELDIDWLKQKTDAGADFIVTQLFLDNRHFFDFLERVRRRGIAIPVIAGLLPFTSLEQLERICGMCRASIPDSLHTALRSGAASDNERLLLCHAVAQAQELARHADGLHLYTLNRAHASLVVAETIRKRYQPDSIDPAIPSRVVSLVS